MARRRECLLPARWAGRRRGRWRPAGHLKHYLTGNAADVVRPTSGLLVLQGGGDDVDENYIRMGARGGGGDFVVLRASGDDDYQAVHLRACAAATRSRP